MSLLTAAHNYAETRAHAPVGTATSPITWFSSMIGGRKTESGITVTEENAISLSTIFNAITLLSETVAQLPLSPYRKTATGREQYTQHPSYRLLHQSPNPWMRSYTWRKMMVNHVCRWGNTYNVIERDGRGNPVSILPVHPARVYSKLDEEHNLWYIVDGGKYMFSAASIIHVMGFTDDGFVGKSNIQVASESIGQSMATNQFGAKYFGKGINVSGFIKHPGKLKDEESVDRLKTSFAKKYGGQNGEFGVGLLEEGSEWIPNEVDPEKAQALESRKFNVEEIARWLNVPVPLLKQLEDGTYNNVEQIDIQFGKYTIAPWNVNFEQEYNEKLLTENEKRSGDVYFKHNMNALLRGDMASRATFYESLSKTGALSPNDIRELEELNPYDGGDVHIVSPGAQTIEQLQNGNNLQDIDTESE